MKTITTKRRFDGMSETLSIDDFGRLVAGDVEVEGIEREEVLFALNAYKATKWTLITAAKVLIYSALIIGTIILLSITDVGVLP